MVGAITKVAGSLSPANVAALVANVSTALADPSILLAVRTAVATSLGVPLSQIGAAVDPSTISAVQTTKTISGGSSIPTRGGTYFFIAGVSSVADTPVASMLILIGGRKCVNLTKAQDGDLGAQYGIDPGSPLASQYLTFRLSCVVPAGVGSNLPILISTGLGLSQDNPNFRLGYAPPAVSGIVDWAMPSLSYTSPVDPATSLQISGVPTLGRKVTIVGSNFGAAALVTGTPALAVPGSFNLSVTVAGAAAGFLKNALVLSHDHEAIVVLLPTGQGAGLSVGVSVGAQTDTDAVGGASRAPAIVRYQAPSVSRVYNQATQAQLDPTVGGSTLCLAGANFGTAGPNASIAQGLPVATVGGAAARLAPTYSATPNHDLVCVVLPEGWGASLPVVVTVAGQASAAAANATYTYAPPSVAAILPASGPTSASRPAPAARPSR